MYLHVLGSTFLISTLLPYFNNVITDSIQPHYIHCLFIWASECCVSYEVIFTMATTAITNKSSVLYHLFHYTHFNNILITNLVHRHFRHFLFICASERLKTCVITCLGKYFSRCDFYNNLHVLCVHIIFNI